MMTNVWAVVRTVVGWALLLAGLAAIVLPGPGLLLILAGLLMLAREYDWARRRVEPVRRRAFQVARASVDDWPRVTISLLGAVGLVAAGVAWWADPVIPEFWIFGPRLPAAGWQTGIGLILSGLVALGLIGYSFVIFRVRGRQPSGSSPGAAGPI
jgi:Putative transmembrane protein (PGPGW)